MIFKIELLDAAVNLTVGDFERDGVFIQAVSVVIRLGGVGLFHQISLLLLVVYSLLIKQLDLLRDRVQFLRFLVVTFVAVATHATALAEQILAVVNHFPLGSAAYQHHVGGVASLAACLNILLRKHRPQPVLVVAVRLFNARGSAAVALMARRAAKLVRIVNLQQVGFRMAYECPGKLVRFLLALGRHQGRCNLQGLANAHVAGFAAVNDVGLGHIGLDNVGVPIVSFLFQALELCRAEVHHVVADVGLQLGVGSGYRLQHLAQFQA